MTPVEQEQQGAPLTRLDSTLRESPAPLHPKRQLPDANETRQSVLTVLSKVNLIPLPLEFHVTCTSPPLPSNALLDVKPLNVLRNVSWILCPQAENTDLRGRRQQQ